jgi:hypothetical protein
VAYDAQNVNITYMSTTRTVAALAAQMAAGSGDSRIEFDGDAGEIYSRDLNSTLLKDGAADVTSSINNSSRIVSSSAPQKLRNAISSTARKDQMIQLKAAVLDALSLLQSMCEDGENRMKALHRRIGENHMECINELHGFDENFVWLDEVGFDVPRAIREGKLTLTAEWLASFGHPVRTPEEHIVAEKFELISERLLSGKESDELISDTRRDITKLLFPFGDGNIPEMMVALNQFTMTDIIGKTNGLLNQTNDALAEVHKKIAEVEAALAKSLMHEQMHEAEKCETELLALAEKRLELNVKRVCILTASDENSQDGGALKQLEQIIRNPIVGQLHSEKEILKQTVEADIQALEADRVEKLRENDNAILRYDANVIKRIKGLQANHALQHEKWVQLEQLIAEISSLGREGDRLTREHVLMTEIEQKRRQEHREYRLSYTNHRQHLDALLENTESAMDFTHQLSSALIEGKEKLIEARIEDSLKDLLKRERKQYLEAFEYYGVKNQTDVGRNEKRMAALDRMSNDLAFVRRQCRDTGDDGSTAYAKRMNDIDRQVRKCRKAADMLEDSFSRHESTYIKLETAMLAALGDQAASVLASSASPHDEPVSLHIKIKTNKADQFRQFVDQVSALTSSTVSTMAELRNRQEQLSVTASSMKEASERKRAANRSSILSSRGTVSPGNSHGMATAGEFDRPAGAEYDDLTADEGDAAAGNTTTTDYGADDTVNVSNIEVENISAIQ